MTTEFRLSKIGVIMLGVADLDRAKHFYRDLLGLELSSSTSEFAFIKAGAIALALTTELPKSLNGRYEGMEVVFAVDHVRVAHRELGSRGIHFSHDPHVATGKNWAANFADPDGHSLSVFGPE